ncbi:MAG: NAD(P)-dependent oxidoreductase, partial [Gammaproteobacteria bacterium]
MELGYLGAGLMAAPMVQNLVADGHAVRVWNRTPARAQALAACGATPVADAADVCAADGVVISCLADDAALDSVFGDGRVLEALGRDGVHASMSTISAACAGRHARAHAGAGCHYVAAPVLGRPDAVAARMQSFLLAGEPAACARVEPVLAALGRRVFPFGDEPAAANVAKINFNFLIASAIEAMGEAFAVVEKAGLDPVAFYEMVTAGAFACPLYQGYGRQIVEHGWDQTGFRLALGLKDVRLAQEVHGVLYEAEVRQIHSLALPLLEEPRHRVGDGIGELDAAIGQTRHLRARHVFIGGLGISSGNATIMMLAPGDPAQEIAFARYGGEGLADE